MLVLHLAPQLGQADLLVIFGSAGGIGEQFVGLLDLLELVLGFIAQGFILDLVGMTFQHEFPMGRLDFG